ncbi:hypothetical protein [Roseivivax sp. CAU 1761]
MSDATHHNAAQGAETDPEDLPEADTSPAGAYIADRLTLEIVFLGFIGLVVLVAFVQALGYELVSSRTPFVIMVPLFVLILVQARRLWGDRDRAAFGERMARVLGGRNVTLNKVLGFSGWMLGLLAAVMAIGHFAAIFGFCVVLMRGLARESWKLTLLVSVATLVAIFLIFEIGFNVELYRGLLIRYFMGYRDF